MSDHMNYIVDAGQKIHALRTLGEALLAGGPMVEAFPRWKVHFVINDPDAVEVEVTDGGGILIDGREAPEKAVAIGLAIYRAYRNRQYIRAREGKVRWLVREPVAGVQVEVWIPEGEGEIEAIEAANGLAPTLDWESAEAR